MRIVSRNIKVFPRTNCLLSKAEPQRRLFGSKLWEGIDRRCHHTGREWDEEAEQEIYVRFPLGPLFYVEFYVGWLMPVFQLSNWRTESEFLGVGAKEAGGWLRVVPGILGGFRVESTWAFSACYFPLTSTFWARTTFLMSFQCPTVIVNLLCNVNSAFLKIPVICQFRGDQWCDLFPPALASIHANILFKMSSWALFLDCYLGNKIRDGILQVVGSHLASLALVWFQIFLKIRPQI